MFGIYRIMLAFWVVIFHLLPIPEIGGYAVFSFFILSGFLMTTIMHQSYGHDYCGIKKYALNRFLRLYPMYWMVCLISVLLIVLLGAEYSSNYKSALSIPSDLQAIVTNFTMIFPSYFPNEINPRLSPPTWALTVEIFYYMLIGLGFSKTYKRTLIWLGLSIGYFIVTYCLALDSMYRYSAILAGSLPFSLGALLFFKKDSWFSLLQGLKLTNPFLLLFVHAGNALFFAYNNYYKPFEFSIEISDVGKFINIILSALVVVVLFFRGSELCNKKIDKIIGDYSYPVYLIHWQCGLLASYLLYQAPTRELTQAGLMTFCLSVFFALSFSFVLIKLVDPSISKIRNRIREPTVSNVAGKLGELTETSIKPILDQIMDGTGSIQTLTKAAPVIIENLRTFTVQLNKSVEHVNALLDPNGGRVDTILADFEDASGNAARLSAEVRQTGKRLDTILVSMNALIEKNKGEIDHSVADLHHTLEVVASHVQEISYNLESTTRNLNEFTAEIRRNPGTLIRGRDFHDDLETRNR